MLSTQFQTNAEHPFEIKSNYLKNVRNNIINSQFTRTLMSMSNYYKRQREKLFWSVVFFTLNRTPQFISKISREKLNNNVLEMELSSLTSHNFIIARIFHLKSKLKKLRSNFFILYCLIIRNHILRSPLV